MKKISIEPNIIDIPQPEDESILESLETCGYIVEYQCREGVCGSCRCRLKAGEVDYIKTPLAALDDHEILPCITKARTDVVLELPTVTISKKRA